MIRNIVFYVCLMVCFNGLAHAEPPPDLSAFAQLPVQSGGRIEPLDSFARSNYKQFYGSMADSQTPTAWLAELLFDPEQAFARQTFNVSHPDVRHALNLPDRANHLYSFREIITAVDAHHDMINSLLNAPTQTITDPAQQQIISLYKNTLVYFDIGRSLSLVLPDFVVDDPELAQKIGVPAKHPFSYLDMIQHKATYVRLAEIKLQNLDAQPPNAEQAALLKIGFLLEHMEADKQSRILQIIPPVWAQHKDVWLSPWAVLQAGQGSPQTAELLKAWQDVAIAYRTSDQKVWDAACLHISQPTQIAAVSAIRPTALQAEYIYNLTHMLAFSGLLYLLTCTAYLFIRRKQSSKNSRLPVTLLTLGFVFHTLGLLLRIYILARPPVGTLYESILFVGWITVAGGLIVERRNRNETGLLIGAVAGLALQSLAPFFALGGDTMEPLVAVLNTNFWLATHVLAITTGYGCCLVTSLLAHVYLVQKIRAPHNREQLAVLLRATVGAALVALCFATIGTVLGGIWADQSWGRFWGWDPKENGALLIVLWLLFILHGKLSGLLYADRFALGAAATIIVVALSWFGVNLLNVGLHSYGFTSGIALYLGLFVAVEISILSLCYALLNRSSRNML